MPRLASIVLMAIALAVGMTACGDDDDSGTTVTETATSETAMTETTGGSGPSGELTTTGVGEVQQGMGTQEVQELFGEPASEEKVPGCELAGPNAKDDLVWTYQLDGGELSLNFDPANGQLGSYTNTSPGLETTLGDGVGDTYASLKENWGGDLEPLPLGTGPTPKAGIYVVKDDQDPRAALHFDIRGGKIAAILGGQVEICE